MTVTSQYGTAAPPYDGTEILTWTNPFRLTSSFFVAETFIFGDASIDNLAIQYGNLQFVDSGVKISSEGVNGLLCIRSDGDISISATNAITLASTTLNIQGNTVLASGKTLAVGTGAANKITFYDSAVNMGSDGVDRVLNLRADGSISLTSAELYLAATDDVTISGVPVNIDGNVNMSTNKVYFVDTDVKISGETDGKLYLSADIAVSLNGSGIYLVGTQAITLTATTGMSIVSPNIKITSTAAVTGEGIIDLAGSTPADGSSTLRFPAVATGAPTFDIGSSAKRLQMVPVKGSVYIDIGDMILYVCATAGTWAAAINLNENHFGA